MDKAIQEIKNILKEYSNTHNVKIEITDWKECGEYSGDDPRPIFKIELTEKVLR